MLGEETVLLKALEGKRGQPEQRPPLPGRARPVRHADRRPQRPDARRRPWIVAQRRRGVRGDRRAGQPGHHPRPGPRRRPATGIAEVPLGTPLREIVGLGRAAARTAARSRRCSSAGRPAASCPPDLLDTPYEFDALRAAGAHVGSGSVVVADERACVVDLARLLTRFCADEACGKTIPCRIGTRRLVGDRRADRDGGPAPDRRRRSLADLAATSSGPGCATTSAWRRFR